MALWQSLADTNVAVESGIVEQRKRQQERFVEVLSTRGGVAQEHRAEAVRQELAIFLEAASIDDYNLACLMAQTRLSQASFAELTAAFETQCEELGISVQNTFSTPCILGGNEQQLGLLGVNNRALSPYSFFDDLSTTSEDDRHSSDCFSQCSNSPDLVLRAIASKIPFSDAETVQLEFSPLKSNTEREEHRVEEQNQDNNPSKESTQPRKIGSRRISVRLLSLREQTSAAGTDDHKSTSTSKNKKKRTSSTKSRNTISQSKHKTNQNLSSQHSKLAPKFSSDSDECTTKKRRMAASKQHSSLDENFQQEDLVDNVGGSGGGHKDSNDEDEDNSDVINNKSSDEGSAAEAASERSNFDEDSYHPDSDSDEDFVLDKDEAQVKKSHHPKSSCRRKKISKVCGEGVPKAKPPSKLKDTCHCKNSKCLKLYCICFAKGAMCNPALCACVGCENNVHYKEKRDQIMEERLAQDEDAFTPKRERSSGFCKCKRSHCLKMYCDCFACKRKCTTECRCENCENI